MLIPRSGSFLVGGLSLLVALGLVAPGSGTAPAESLPGRQESESTSTAEAEEGEPLVLGRTFQLDSEVFAAPRTINVWTPFGYDEREEEFPVLYVVDGGVQQDFQPMAGMGALACLSLQFREFIVVGVQTENRHWELTPPSTVAADLEAIPRNGGAPRFRRHLLEEVRPFVRARYRTSSEDAIIGESLAGLFIADTFLRAPSSFTHSIAVSPSLWWRDMGLSHEAAELLREADLAGRSLYLSIADEGGTMQEGMDRLVAALREGAPDTLRWWYEPMPDEHHHTIYNPSTLRALRKVFAAPE